VYVGIPPEDCTVIAEDGVTSAPLAVDVEGDSDSLEQTV
jgi:hypothetical protein